jgi:glycosyltransferase involved in cell wall biosynthesis
MGAIDLLTEASPGLLTDARVISAALAPAGFEPRLQRARYRNLDLRVPGLLRRLRREPIAAANIHFERIWPGWLGLAEKNLFLPNQEWCGPAEVALFGRLDAVLCKTRYAEDIFHRRGLRAEYIGFNSDDRYDAGVRKDYSQFIHVAGRSDQKGTDTVVRVWQAHPEWPTLRIVSSRPNLAQKCRAGNIRVIGREISAADLHDLQNRCGVHLCPSEAEGFGHYICEAMGCGAIVITTDAPPMNELVTRERGLLAAYARSAPQALGVNYYVDPAALEAAVAQVLRMGDSRREELSRAARAWYLANKRDFEARLPQVLGALL